MGETEQKIEWVGADESTLKRAVWCYALMVGPGYDVVVEDGVRTIHDSETGEIVGWLDGTASSFYFRRDIAEAEKDSHHCDEGLEVVRVRMLIHPDDVGKVSGDTDG